ncbi:MAG: cyclic nucleotide-binding domain-containing protein [Polyangiales bacterium]
MIRADQLGAFQMLRDYTARELDVLLGAAKLCRFMPGESLCEEGSLGASCFFVVTGDVEVTRRTPDGPRVIAIQGAGAIVGQMALVERLPRTATVRATTEVTALEFNRDVFDALLEASSPFAIRFQEQIAVAGIRQLRNATERLLDTLGPASEPPPSPAAREAARSIAAASHEWALPALKAPRTPRDR